MKERSLVLFPDLHGIPRGKIHSQNNNNKIKLGASSGVFSKDIYGRPVLFDKLAKPTGAADIIISANVESYYQINQCSSSDFFGSKFITIGDVFINDDTPHPLDTRARLKNFIDSIDTDLDIKVGAELEFYLLPNLKSIAEVDGQAYGMYGLAARQACLTEILDTLDSLGIHWLDCSQENEVDQYEISLVHSEPLRQADNIFIARFCCRFIARKHDLICSFIAVIDKKYSPSNLHLHVSAYKKRKSLLSSSYKESTLVKGIVNNLHESLAIYLPSYNSRYIKDIDSFSAKESSTGINGRFTAIRVIPEQGGRIELRTPTSDCNPYLAILMLVAGISLNDKEAISKLNNPLKFNYDCANSLHDFSTSSFINKVLGPEFVTLFEELKRLEFDFAEGLNSIDSEKKLLMKVI